MTIKEIGRGHTGTETNLISDEHAPGKRTDDARPELIKFSIWDTRVFIRKPRIGGANDKHGTSAQKNPEEALADIRKLVLAREFERKQVIRKLEVSDIPTRYSVVRKRGPDAKLFELPEPLVDPERNVDAGVPEVLDDVVVGIRIEIPLIRVDTHTHIDPTDKRLVDGILRRVSLLTLAIRWTPPVASGVGLSGCIVEAGHAEQKGQAQCPGAK